MMSQPTGLPALYSKPTPEPAFIHIDYSDTFEPMVTASRIPQYVVIAIDEAGEGQITSGHIGPNPLVEDTNEEIAAFLRRTANYLESLPEPQD